MSITITNFEPSQHLDAAAALLADRQTRDRERDPRLPSSFTMAEACRPVIEQSFASSGWRGVIAHDGTTPVGFLIMTPQLFAPTHFLASFFPPHSAAANYQQHAAKAGMEYDVYREMYAVLADAFVGLGYFDHLVAASPSDAGGGEAWASLGFARHSVAAMRGVGPTEKQKASVEVHQASAEDADVIFKLSGELTLHHAKSPIFWPYLRETDESSHDMQRGLLTDPQANAHLVAYENGKPIGMNTFMPPAFLSPLLLPPKAVYLFQGIVTADARTGGVGTAILSRGAEWAREQGYEYITLHFAAPNLQGARFWQSSGFVPVEYGLRRRVDERIAWANR
jgi:GNAT superfamily N-acetyltransferase